MLLVQVLYFEGELKFVCLIVPTSHKLNCSNSNSVKQTLQDHCKKLSLYNSSVASNLNLNGGVNGVVPTSTDCILIFLLAGGEYCPGVGHCDRATAHALARCGFGQTLATGCVTYQGDIRRRFIASWLDGVCKELRDNTLGILGHRHPTLAHYLCESVFPSNEIIDLYLFPCTSYSTSAQGPNSSAWIFGEGPKIDRLAAAAINCLEFKNTAELCRMFYCNIWRATAVRTFLSVSVS